MKSLHALAILLIYVALASCATSKPEFLVKTYLEVKKDFLSALESSSEWGPHTNYRLVVIPPMVEPYKPGTPLLKGSYEPLTDSCLVPEEMLGVSTEIADPPVSTHDATIDLRFGITPNILAVAVKQLADFRTTTNIKESALFSLSLSKAMNARTDILKKAALNEGCLRAIVGEDVVMVRGLIYGFERIASLRSLRADMTTQIIGEQNVEVKYDTTGGYEVRDYRPMPKFWIVSDWRVDIADLTPVTSSTQRAEIIRNHLKDKPLEIVFSVQAPSKATVTEMVDRMVPSVPVGLVVQ